MTQAINSRAKNVMMYSSLLETTMQLGQDAVVMGKDKGLTDLLLLANSQH